MTETFVDITRERPADRWDDLLHRVVSGPPGWVFLAVLLADSALMIVACTAPGVLLGKFLVATFGWLVLGAAWIGKAALALLFSGRLFRDWLFNGWWAALRREAWRWLLAPLVVITVMLVVASGLPERAGLAGAQPAMREYASDPRARKPSRVGIFNVSYVRRLPGGGAVFQLADAGFFESCGYVYSPAGEPRSLRDAYSYEHITGPWYRWTLNESF